MANKLLETYVSLHNHTDYSNLKFPDSTNRIGTLIDRAHELGLLGVAITDHDTVSGYIKAENHLSKRRKENPEDETWQNFKLILGNEIYLCRNGLNKDNYEAGKDSYFHFILLAKDKVGNDQIRELSSRAWTRSYFYFHNRVPTYWSDLEDIIQRDQGHVVGSTACLGGQLARLIVSREEATNDSVKNVYNEAIKLVVNKWLSIFGEGNFYFELQPGVTKEQILVNKRLYELSQEMNVPCIITTDTHYLTVEDRPVHKAFLTSKAGDRETDAFYEATYMMTTDEIRERMDYLSAEDINQMFQNTIDIGNACEEYTLKRSLEIPYMSKDEYDEELRYELNIDKTKYPYFYKFYNSSKPNRQLIVRLFNFINEDDYSKEHFTDSLTTAETELKIIWDSSEKMGVDWSKYFLQVADIIKVVWTLGDSITAPSRGSAGASFVLYALGVIQINPMREKAPLIFERFLNPDRASVLDIDTDLESNKRQRCISALQEVYGEDRVVRVATFRTETTRQVIKTAGRGLGMEQDTYDFVASLIGSNRGVDYSLSEMYYGSEEKQLKPNPTFVQQMNKYPDLWTTASTLEGIISGIGVHAGGVILDERPIYETAGVMRTNKGEIVTSFELNDCQEVSLIKVDLLSTKALSKIRTCIDLLCDYGYAETGNSLKETYESIIGIYNLDRTSPEMWKMTHEGQITSLFQMEKQSGVQGIRLTKPESVEDLATLNSVIRLQAPERGMEQPLDKYARFREHPEQWEVEMDRYGLSEDEKTLMHEMLDHSSGISAQQEDLYQIILEPKIAGFSFGEADKLRKIIAKKQMDQIEGYHEKVISNAKKKGLSKNLVTYAWEQLVLPQAGYSFNLAHTLAYSLVALQEMNLAYHYPIVFWNTANLIVDSGAEYEAYDFYNLDDTFNYEADDSVTGINYGKIATAIGDMQQDNVQVAPPNINKSNYTFTPDPDNNIVRYGLMGISGVNEKIANEIITKRPFDSYNDFKQQMESGNISTRVNLIKSGAFDSFGDRREIMKVELTDYANLKNNLTLQNANMLIQHGLLPEEELGKNISVFNFNKYIKQKSFYDKEAGTYFLDERAYLFYQKHFDIDKLTPAVNGGFTVGKDEWKTNVYDKYMNPVRDYIKNNKEELLEKLNNALIQEQINDRADGSLAKWSMDSVSFYQNEHELDNVNFAKYGIKQFYDMPEEPQVDYTFTVDDDGDPKEINMYQLYYIAGTVIDKDKNKNMVTILCTDGVVNVRAFGIFPHYDQRISETLSNGRKRIIEKSMFTRGNKIMVYGMRRGSEFVAKKYKNSPAPHHFREIVEVLDNGDLIIKDRQTEG